jgi:integrase
VGRVHKPLVYKPLPAGAELFTRRGERLARWTDRRGRTRTAPVAVPKRGAHAGQARIVVQSGFYWAEYRDADGFHPVPTKCRDESAARGVLRELERRAELVKGNLLSASEARTADHQTTPLAEHFAAFETYLETRASSGTHRATVMARLRRLSHEAGFATLANLDRARLEAWMASAPASFAARTRNGYVTAMTSFCNWAVNAGRLVTNPFHRMPRLNERAGQKRPRRAMTAAELVRLIEAARRRPLAEHGRKPIRLERPEGEPHKRASWTYEPVTPDSLADCEARTRDRLRDRPDVLAEAEAAGRLRALTYKALVLTGLRLNELRSLTVGQVDLDGAEPYATLRAADEKARRGAEIPLRADLAVDLSQHLAERLRIEQRAAKRENRPIPARLPADASLLHVPDALVKCLNRDLVAAGIAVAVHDGGDWRTDKRDERGRGLDVHCLRHTFNSLLAAADVPLTTRRILMRHAGGGMTDEHYTDRTLIDVRGALDKLPRLLLDPSRPTAEPLAATGTGGKSDVDARFTVCRPVYSAHDKSSTSGAIVDTCARNGGSAANIASDVAGNGCEPLPSADEPRRKGVEPLTFGSVGRCSVQLS